MTLPPGMIFDRRLRCVQVERRAALPLDEVRRGRDVGVEAPVAGSVVDADVTVADLLDLESLERRAAVVAGAEEVRGRAVGALDDGLQGDARLRALLLGRPRRRHRRDRERGKQGGQEDGGHAA